MTKTQVEGFKQYVKENAPGFYPIMDSVCVFVPIRDGEDYCYLLENAFGPVLPSSENLKTYSSLLLQYQKDNKIYKPVPTIADDFWTYLSIRHERLAMQLNGEMDVILENGSHKPIILPNAGHVSDNQKQEFFSAWESFNKTLIRI